MSWVVRIAGALIAIYVVLSGGVLAAMLQPPERFGQIMRFAPTTVVWGLLPGARIWSWARAGQVGPGTVAPDFTLPTQEGTSSVTLSSFRGRQPVVLVFGSYT